MAKINLGELLINTLAPTLETVITAKLTELLDDLAVKDAAAHKTVVTSLYGPVDVHLEKLTTKSRTKIDDAVVNGIKSAIENSADTAGVELQNLDED